MPQVKKKKKSKQRETEQALFWLPPAVNRAIKREAKQRGMTRSGVVIAALMARASIRGYAVEEVR